MHSVCFKIGWLPIHWYGVMLATGFLAGLINWTLLGRKEKKDFNFCSDLLFWIMVSGILGGRLAYVLSNIEYYRNNPISAIFVWEGGLIYYGGFIGAAIAVFVFAKLRKQHLLTLYDFVIVSVPLAHVFGRIGCFLNGCCHGRIYDGFLTIKYPAKSPAWWTQIYDEKITRFSSSSLPVIPVQLYEAALNLALYLILVFAYRHKKHEGSTTAIYFLLYPFARFWLEFLRGDERMTWMGLSVAQLVSIILILIGIILLWHSQKKDVLKIDK